MEIKSKIMLHLNLILLILSCVIFGLIMIIGSYNLIVLFLGTFIFLNFGSVSGMGISDYLIAGPWGPAGSFSLMIYFFVWGTINFTLVCVSFYIISKLKEAYDENKKFIRN